MYMCFLTSDEVNKLTAVLRIPQIPHGCTSADTRRSWAESCIYVIIASWIIPNMITGPTSLVARFQERPGPRLLNDQPAGFYESGFRALRTFTYMEKAAASMILVNTG